MYQLVYIYIYSFFETDSLKNETINREKFYSIRFKIIFGYNLLSIIHSNSELSILSISDARIYLVHRVHLETIDFISG